MFNRECPPVYQERGENMRTKEKKTNTTALSTKDAAHRTPTILVVDDKIENLQVVGNILQKNTTMYELPDPDRKPWIAPLTPRRI